MREEKELDSEEIISMAQEIIGGMPDKKDEAHVLAEKLQNDLLNEFTAEPSEAIVDQGEAFLKKFRSWKSDIKAIYGLDVTSRISLDTLYRIAFNARRNFQEEVDNLVSNPELQSEAKLDLDRWIQIESVVYAAKSLAYKPREHKTPPKNEQLSSTKSSDEAVVDNFLAELGISLKEASDVSHEELKHAVSEFVDNFFKGKNIEECQDQLAIEFRDELDTWANNSGLSFKVVALHTINHTFLKHQSYSTRALRSIGNGNPYDQDNFTHKSQRWARILEIIQAAVYG